MQGMLPTKDQRLDAEPTVFLRPGAQHPWQPLSEEGAAELLRVRSDNIREWCAAGMPRRADGFFDALDVVNWVCWNRLFACPVLARRWRTFAAWFGPAEQMRPRCVRWQRTHRLYLPHEVDSFRWWIPTPIRTLGQHIERDEPLNVLGCSTLRSGGFWVLEGVPVGTVVTASGVTDVSLNPRVILAPQTAEHRLLMDMMEGVVEEFRYEYRFHTAGEFTPGSVTPERWIGSCLDCAMTMGAELEHLGRRWRLMSGIIAHSAIANPHYWIECQGDSGQWIPCDPTIPAIFKMLGRDWRSALSRSVGIQDCGRITISAGMTGLPGIPGGASCRSTGGEAQATVKGIDYNATACIDWACAECTASFSGW